MKRPLFREDEAYHRRVFQSDTDATSRRQQSTKTKKKQNKEKIEAKSRGCIRCEHKREAHKKSRRESQLHGEKLPHREKPEDKFVRRQG